MTNTGCLLTTSDNEIGPISERPLARVPSGCGVNRAILRCRPRPWNRQSRSASASSDPIFARNAARPNRQDRR